MSSCCHHAGTGNYSCISHVPIFQDLSDTEITMLSQAVQSRTYRKGELIYQEGERSQALYVIHEGVVKVSKSSDTGKERVLRFLYPGDFEGQFALFKEGLHYATAEAVEDVVVCRVYRSDLKRILDHNPDMAYRFLAAMSERLRDADEWVGSMSLMDAEKRLAKTLLIISEKQMGSGNELPVSKKDFAALVGMAPETLSRKLAGFESQGLISLQGKKGIEIINRQGLADVAGYE